MVRHYLQLFRQETRRFLLSSLIAIQGTQVFSTSKPRYGGVLWLALGLAGRAGTLSLMVLWPLLTTVPRLTA